MEMFTIFTLLILVKLFKALELALFISDSVGGGGGEWLMRINHLNAGGG